MAGLQEEKQLVRDYYRALDAARGREITEVLERFCAPDLFWRGYHPFHERTGPKTVAEVFWEPLHAALFSLQRRQDIFFAARNSLHAGGTWVVSMGHLMGLFDEPFLGIPATRRIAMLRYCEFNRVEGGRITEAACFIDLPQLMRQAGLEPFPAPTGVHLIQPGPMTHDGLLYEDQPLDEGKRTLDLINTMIGDINHHESYASADEELHHTWHDDMIWWGPDGIGATYTIPRYIEQHQGPFRQKIVKRVYNGHVCRLAEGNYGGFFGWPNLTLTPSGGYLGGPFEGEGQADMRVIDIYRRSGSKLAENWVFIDIPHFLAMQGKDILPKV
ncbi:MAG: ester cyclase [Paracoccaceae bacterium]|nr:ester cyclase [Paracoccaceae bacterium]